MEKSNSKILLSICIATLNRGRFINETLGTIIPQLCDGTELIIVDGASTDSTPEIAKAFSENNPRIRYVRLDKASGVDKDYDIAVSHARGEFVWLMTDDDLMKPKAIDRVISKLDTAAELIIVNSEVRTVDFSSVLCQKLVQANVDLDYTPSQADQLLSETANALSFIGCVIIRREFWNSRRRTPYFGSCFVHVGVIFQDRTPHTRLISEPLIIIRYGNAMWTPQGFEIWMFKWPELIWSFSGISTDAKSRICRCQPWRQKRKLWLYRSIGGYGTAQFKSIQARNELSLTEITLARLISLTPTRLANAISGLWCLFFARDALMNIYDLSNSRNASAISRLAAHAAGLR